MDFQPNLPSIPSIRAKFIIEKLGNYPRNLGSINLFVTGRTGSGKTTLGNRLLGIDYFLSTGRQDCTKEVNLIEFPIGLRYFDLPGVCSDDKLENFNRFALGIEQIEDFPVIENLTLAKFCEGKNPQEQKLSVNDFINLQLKPDLIFYLIAPDKQFTRNDRKYLRDLLKRHHQIVYVFNMFVNQDTGRGFAATEANLIDAATKVVELHTSVLGKNNQPIIVGVNCWTGEGIANLLVQSQVILGGTKGKLFEELIKYQQHKTPNEYVHKVKLELLRLFAHAACQKPNGNSNCEQSIYKDCHTLLNFITDLQETSEATSSLLGETISNLVNEILNNSLQQPFSSGEEKIDSIIRGINVIEEGIDLINEKIDLLLFNAQREALDYRNQQIQAIDAELENHAEDIDSLDREIHSLIETYNYTALETRSLIEEVNSSIEEYDANVEELNLAQIDLISRQNKLDSRIKRYNSRLENYNDTIERINSGWGRPSKETRKSLEKERDYLERQEDVIHNKKKKLKKKIRNFQKSSKLLENEEESLTEKIQLRDEKVKELKSEEDNLVNKIKLRNQSSKYLEDKAEFAKEIINCFDRELNQIDDQIKSGIQEINNRLKEIEEIISELSIPNSQLINDEANSLFQEKINICIDEMETFFEKIFSFHREITICVAKLEINKLVTEVVLKCTNYHFNDTDDYAYRGSTYTYFQKHALILLLFLVNLLISEDKTIADGESLHKNILSKVNNLGAFPNTPKEADIFKLLERRIDSLFPTTFDEKVRKVAL